MPNIEGVLDQAFVDQLFLSLLLPGGRGLAEWGGGGGGGGGAGVKYGSGDKVKNKS